MNARRLLASTVCLTLGLVAPARAVLVSDFGATAPSSNVVVSSVTPSGSGSLQWRNNRNVVMELTAPVTFSLAGFGLQSFTSSGISGATFTLSLVQLTTLGTAPTDAQIASPLYTETGTLGTITDNDFVQFTLATPQTLTAGAVYGVELAFTSATGVSGINFRQVAGGITSGTNAADLGPVFYGNNGGTTLTTQGTQFVTYIQGTAVPEPRAAALLGAGLLLAAAIRFRRAIAA